MDASLNLEVPNIWKYVREVRDQVLTALEGLPKELCEATEMAVGELMENAIKYGDEVPACREIRVALRVRDDAVQVEISNGVTNDRSLRRVRARIDEIKAGDSREALYLDRMRHLLEHPEESGNLGLYRIAFEGRFDLDYVHRDEVLSITASRTLESSAP